MTHLFVHYHLRAGGVSRVIEHEIAYFREQQLPHHIISATPRPGDPQHHVLAALDYDPAPACRDAAALTSQLLACATGLPAPHIWHVHNPLLGCHPTFTAAMNMMLQHGERMIWHLHDFAEDRRPLQLAALQDQPARFARASHLRYIVLSQRDASILQAAGLPAAQCHVLPPPVKMEQPPAKLASEPLIFYPTRAIERKNLAELCLLAALLPAPYQIATSQRPQHPRWREGHDFWENFAQEQRLPLRFGVVEDHQLPFLDWVGRASHLLSTSVQEGFGLIFLEAIAWQKPLIGRDIPHISADLAAQQIHHTGLYQQLFHRDHAADFSQLPRDLQAQLIAGAASDPQAFHLHHHERVISIAAWWDDVLKNTQSPALPALSPFSVETHGRSLHRIAQDLADSPTGAIAHLHLPTLLQAFAPETPGKQLKVCSTSLSNLLGSPPHRPCE